MATAVQVTESCTHHGEGPFWDSRVGRLLFVDMLAGVVVEWDTTGPVKRHAVGTVAAVVRARARGGYVLARRARVRLRERRLQQSSSRCRRPSPTRRSA